MVQEVDAVVHLRVGVRVAIHPLLVRRCEMEFFLVYLSMSVTVAINRTTKIIIFRYSFFEFSLSLIKIIWMIGGGFWFVYYW